MYSMDINKNRKENKPLSESEIKSVYRNDFYSTQSKKYFKSREDKIMEEYWQLKKEGFFDE